MKIYYLLFVGLVLLACSDRELPVQSSTSSQPVLEIFHLPEFINPGKTFFVAASVRDDAGGQDVSRVYLTISKQGENSPLFTFTLYDDGAALHPNDGDVVAHDGVFSQRIYWQPPSASRQQLVFRFEASNESEQKAEPVEQLVTSLSSAAPRIVSVTLPDTLQSGFEGELLFEVAAADSDGVEDIRQVMFKGVRNDTVFFTGELYDDATRGDATAHDGTFTLAVDRTFAVGKKGDYTLQFTAIDRSELSSERVDKSIYIGNEAPVISNLEAPTQVQIPVSGSVTHLITLKVNDPQGADDIKFVGFMSLKPDSTYANGGQPIPMVDNGLPLDLQRWSQQYFGDQFAGDGVYSITAIIQSTDSPGQYVWTFSATDFVGNKSEIITHIITLVK